MKRKITILYSWKRTDGTPTDPSHVSHLENCAMYHIFNTLSSSGSAPQSSMDGEFSDHVNTSENGDPEFDINYTGNWQMKTTEVLESDIIDKDHLIRELFKINTSLLQQHMILSKELGDLYQSLNTLSNAPDPSQMTND